MIDASDEIMGQPRSGAGGLHRGAESEHTEDHEQQWPLDRFVGLFGLEAAGETNQHRAADRPDLNREPVERLAEHHGDNRGEHDRQPAMQRPRGERRTVKEHEVPAPAQGVDRRLGAHHEENVAGAQRQGLEFVAHAFAAAVEGEDDHAEALAEAQFTDALADNVGVRSDGALEDDALVGRDLL